MYRFPFHQAQFDLVLLSDRHTENNLQWWLCSHTKALLCFPVFLVCHSPKLRTMTSAESKEEQDRLKQLLFMLKISVLQLLWCPEYVTESIMPTLSEPPNVFFLIYNSLYLAYLKYLCCKVKFVMWIYHSWFKVQNGAHSEVNNAYSLIVLC